MIANYKICINYNKRVERCMYAYCTSYKHAMNTGLYQLRKIYGMKKTGHYITVEKITK
jgi:hypothetical protein